MCSLRDYLGGDYTSNQKMENINTVPVIPGLPTPDPRQILASCLERLITKTALLVSSGSGVNAVIIKEIVCFCTKFGIMIVIVNI